MRIINQRRDRSVNFDNVEIHIEDTRIFAVGNQKILLGEYDTGERAQELFEEIHKTYVKNMNFINGVGFKKQYFQISNTKKADVFYVEDDPQSKIGVRGEKVVYYMPEF